MNFKIDFLFMLLNIFKEMTSIIEKRICLDHENLNSDIRKCIYEKIKESINNECTKEHGYILGVKRLIKIKDNYISNVNCDNIFIVEIEAYTLKPEIGKKFKGEVCMIFNGGIFLNIKNKQKVLIPVSTLKNYSYDTTNRRFQNNKKQISVGDEINVEITGTKYSKQSFSCFGNMIEED